ncbi:MAG: hypothetical protein WDN66_03825 [Candidatus Saccharibacteria bacterium]
MSRRPRAFTAVMQLKRGDWFKVAPAIIILIVVGIASAYVNHKLSAKDTNLKSQGISKGSY